MSQEASGSTRFSFAHGANIDYIETLYADFKRDPASVDETWRKFFEGYEFATLGDTGVRLEKGSAAPSSDHDREAPKVEALINAYRRLGHLSAHLNPLAAKPPLLEDLTPEGTGLTNVEPG